MNYSIIKFKFTTGVHFGTGILNSGDIIFHADSLFSALYIEALKQGRDKELYDAVKNGQLLFSDTFPYAGNVYYLPKPILRIKTDAESSSTEKKKYKKLKFIPIDYFETYVREEYKFDYPVLGGEFGKKESVTKVAIKSDENMPYQVGTFFFSEECGLYIIIAFENINYKNLFEDLLISLSLSGIGGKRTSGLGKFEFYYEKNIGSFLNLINKNSEMHMCLSGALPKECEMDKALEEASYRIEKRSGFIYSQTYSETMQKKKDLFVFSAGSCFRNVFEGDVYDVSLGGNHPVYRYSKTIFLGV